MYNNHYDFHCFLYRFLLHTGMLLHNSDQGLIYCKIIQDRTWPQKLSKPATNRPQWKHHIEIVDYLCFLCAMFLRSLRPACHLCKINCSRKQSTWLSLSHAARNRRMCSGQKLQTHSQQKNTKFSYRPLCCFSTTNPICKERGRKPGHEENEESIINKLAESQDEGKKLFTWFL